MVLVVTLFLKGHTTVGAVYAIFSWTTSIYSNIRTINNIFRQLPLRFVELEKYLDTIDQEYYFDEEKKKTYKSGKENEYLKKYLKRRLSIINYSISMWLKNVKYINSRNLFIYFSRFISL